MVDAYNGVGTAAYKRLQARLRARYPAPAPACGFKAAIEDDDGNSIDLVDHDTLPATAPKCTHEFVDFSAENLDPYVPYTIDAMEALVRGIDAAVKSGRAPQGPVLFNEIKKVSFAGVTGVVTFDENGDRGGNMGYSVFNHDGAGFNWIGFSQLGVFAPCSPLVNGPFTCVGTAHSTGDGSVPKQTVQEMNADTVLRVMVSRDTSYLYAAAEKSPVHGVGHITAGILPAMMYTSMSAVGLAYEFDFVTTVAAGNSAAVVARASATGAGAANTPTPDPPQSHNAALAESTTLCAALLRTKPGLGVSSAALVPIRPEDMLNSSHPCMDPSFVRAEIFETRLALQVNNLDKQMDILQASFSSLISPGVVALLSDPGPAGRQRAARDGPAHSGLLLVQLVVLEAHHQAGLEGVRPVAHFHLAPHQKKKSRLEKLVLENKTLPKLGT